MYIGILNQNRNLTATDLLYTSDAAGQKPLFRDDCLILYIEPAESSQEKGMVTQLFENWGLHKSQYFVRYNPLKNKGPKTDRVTDEKLKNTLEFILLNIEYRDYARLTPYKFTEFPKEYVAYINAVLNYPSKDRTIDMLKADVEIEIIKNISESKLSKEEKCALLDQYGMNGQVYLAPQNLEQALAVGVAHQSEIQNPQGKRYHTL